MNYNHAPYEIGDKVISIAFDGNPADQGELTYSLYKGLQDNKTILTITGFVDQRHGISASYDGCITEVFYSAQEITYAKDVKQPKRLRSWELMR